MLDPRIIDEAYNELNEESLSLPKEILESKVILEDKDENFDMSKVKKLVDNISSLLHKFDDIDDEDRDNITDIINAVNKSVVKMVDELKTIVNKQEDKKDEDDKKEEADSKADDDKDVKDGEEKDSKKDGDKDSDSEDEDSEEADKEDKDEDGNEKSDSDKADEVSNMLKMFPTTESVTSPKGVEYQILETNTEKSLVKDLLTGEQFKINTDILKKWKNS